MNRTLDPNALVTLANNQDTAAMQQAFEQSGEGVSSLLQLRETIGARKEKLRGDRRFHSQAIADIDNMLMEGDQMENWVNMKLKAIQDQIGNLR